MNRKSLNLVLVALALMLPGCAKKLSPSVPASRVMPMLAEVVTASPRFVAERDKLEIVTPESELQKSWESVIAFCGTIQCEVVYSSITTRTGYSAPSAGLSVRVAPEDLSKLLAAVQKLGKIGQHTTEREDKTSDVVDTDAKIKNLTTFRDNLRAMLAKTSATVQDLVEIQKQLTDTQSELDSETAQRKILANETEKIAVEMSFRVESPSASSGGFAQIWDALRESGSVLADSTSSLITTIVAIVPWLVLIVPVMWIVVRAWRKFKLRRNRTGLAPQQ
jgi:hypothetical protein